MAERFAHLVTDTVTNEEDRFISALAHGLAFVAPVVGPLVLLVIYHQRSPFVRYHCCQALVAQVVCMSLLTVVAVLTCGMSGYLSPVLLATEAWFAFMAYSGKWAGYPGLGELGRS